MRPAAKAVLIVEADDPRRAALTAAFGVRGRAVFEVADAFEAMTALRCAEFGAAVASEGNRQLSLRGLCQLARR